MPFTELKHLIQNRRFRFGGQLVEVPLTTIKMALLLSGESPLPCNVKM